LNRAGIATLEIDMWGRALKGARETYPTSTAR